MTALQQGTDQSPQGLTSADPVASAPEALRASPHVAEVNALRLRVAQLEAELAAIRTPRATPRPPVPTTSAPEVAETTPPRRPLEVVAEDESATTPAAPVPNPGFAQAWEAETEIDDDVTFAEKLADRAFFDGTTVDERSRNWLLGS